MISHGFVSARCSSAVGVIYDRMHTREIAAYGGLSTACRSTPSPSWSSRWRMSACRAPAGFVGEFLTMAGAFQANTWVAIGAATGVILSAAYALYLYRRVVFGALVKTGTGDHSGPQSARDPRPSRR